MTRTPAWARTAMVSTSSPLAAQAGLWAIEQGGNATDAAIASDAVLGVVQPFWTGVGGDLFCLVDDGHEVVGFNGSGASPAGLTFEACASEAVAAESAAAAAGWPAEMLEDFPPTLPDTSALAVTVPGAVDGWAQLAERFGRLPLSRTLDPARQLASEGFPAGRIAARHWRAAANRLRGGGPFATAVRAGERVRNPALATTLAAIAQGGRDAHYTGRWAADAVATVQSEGGLLTAADLAAHRGEWTTPIAGSYRGHEVLQHPPNGQGAAVLVALSRLERALAVGDVSGDDRAGERLTAIVLAVRDGMRAAHRHVADPRTIEIPAFWERTPERVSGETVFTAAVGGGLAVSLISSVFHQFGSGITAGGAVLQNRGLGFSLEPSSPNRAGPGKRPFHTIIPAMVRRDGKPWAAFGVVGGPMQPQGQVQVLSAIIDRGLDPQAALDEPRARWLGGDLVALEDGADFAAAAMREARLSVLTGALPSAEFGAGQVIRIHGDGWLEGGADPRRDGVASGR